MSGHPGYRLLLDEMWDLHCRKANSYGSDEDPLANLRNGERFGMSAWQRCLVESDSAFYRMQNYCNGRNPSTENAENALMDTAAFALLALLFLREEQSKTKADEDEEEDPEAWRDVVKEQIEFRQWKEDQRSKKAASLIQWFKNNQPREPSYGMSGTAETWVVPAESECRVVVDDPDAKQFHSDSQKLSPDAFMGKTGLHKWSDGRYRLDPEVVAECSKMGVNTLDTETVRSVLTNGDTGYRQPSEEIGNKMTEVLEKAK